jgi:hypothetical protein
MVEERKSNFGAVTSVDDPIAEVARPLSKTLTTKVPRASRNDPERSVNAPFNQHCKTGTDIPQERLPQRRRQQDEMASDNWVDRVCFCTRTNHVGIGYARSNTLYAG